MDFIVKKSVQRFYIMRRLKSVTTQKEYFSIYCGIVRSLLEYACASFIGISSNDATRLQKVQKRCLKIKGSSDAENLFKSYNGQKVTRS